MFRIVMRLRTPPLLPTYVLLGTVVLFAVGSLWIGLDRLDEIERLGESRTTSVATLEDLQNLQVMVTDILDSAQRYSRSGETREIEVFERARRDVPPLLSRLRDRMRLDAVELAQVEVLVPLIARATAFAAAAIEHRRGAADEAWPAEPGANARETGDAIRAVVEKLESREQDKFDRDGRMLAVSIYAARILRYLVAGMIVLLAALLFMAARRLRSFLQPGPRADAAKAVEVAPGGAVDATDRRVGALLDEALVRVRLAAGAQPLEPEASERLQGVAAELARARDEHARVEADLHPAGSERDGVIGALTSLAQSYSRPDGLNVGVTIDQSASVTDHGRAFLIRRVAEWALEAITVRKRAGEIALSFTASGGDATLRILALLDKPDARLRLAPRENDEVGVLQRAAADLGGRLVVSQGPIGFATMLMLPLER